MPTTRTRRSRQANPAAEVETPQQDENPTAEEAPTQDVETPADAPAPEVEQTPEADTSPENDEDPAEVDETEGGKYVRYGIFAKSSGRVTSEGEQTKAAGDLSRYFNLTRNMITEEVAQLRDWAIKRENVARGEGANSLRWRRERVRAIRNMTVELLGRGVEVALSYYDRLSEEGVKRHPFPVEKSEAPKVEETKVEAQVDEQAPQQDATQAA